MAFIKLIFRPGINRDQTNYTGEGGWWDCDKVRFRSGFPEKIGGWTKVTTQVMAGVCRQMWNWITSYQDNIVALGTNKKVYLEAGANLFDITPIRATFDTPDTDNCIATTSGSTTVTISLTAHGGNTGDFVTISGVTGDVGGIPDAEINANHVITVIDSGTFTFTVATAATSTVGSGGGTAIIVAFEIEPGNAIAVEGYGWSTGTWGEMPWGLGSSQPVFLPQRDWWFDNFDNDLVMNIRNGAIYYWERGSLLNPDTAYGTRAKLLSELADDNSFDPDAVPAAAMQILLSQQDKHLLAFGAVPFGSTLVADFDPMLIRWADQDNPFQWTPLPTNSAGFIRVSRGSKIVRALPTRQEILVWTDTHLYTLQFLGTTDVFGLQEYADNVSIIAPRAAASASNVTYWMGRDKFYSYSGRVDTLPCTVRNYVFENLNFNQAAQIVCGTNEEWNEIWWFYPSAESSWNDRYVVFNYIEQIWYFGNMVRTAWLDAPSREFPLATTCPGGEGCSTLYNHEDGVNDDGLPLPAYIQSNDFDLDEGDSYILCRRLIPDVSFDGSNVINATPEVNVELRPRNFPGGAYRNDAANTQPVIKTSVDTYTDQVFIRARARQMAFKLSSENLGVQWQLGSPRLDVRTDGTR
jgi:hypothetical protein